MSVTSQPPIAPSRSRLSSMAFIRIAAALILLVLAAGCKKNPPPPPPPPPTPAPKKSAPRPQPAPPAVEAQPQPSAPPATRRPSPFPQSDQPAPAPQLGQVLSSSQQQNYARAIDVSLRRARQALAVLGKRQLSEAQRGEMSRIESFVKQAEQYRSTDLVTAKNLAERADTLARDLVGRSNR